MATVYTREWIQFFTGCGIPDDIAAMYALIFYENRIQKNMLLDLNKEYLRDMGITVMGDVIAILRHAKIVHEKYVRAKILLADDNIVMEQNNSVDESSPGIKKTTPMKRMLEHYTRKYNSQKSESISEVEVILPNEKVTFPKPGGEKIRIQRPLKKKIQAPSKEKNLKEERLEVPVPKVRRVLPENEGGYKIKMPSGTTERSKKLLELAKRRKAKTVFDRLGESSVSSTTSEISTSSTLSSPLNREKNPSVFSRLGEKTSVVSSTSSIDDSETLSPDHLPYAGILKAAALKKNLPNTTMRADEQQQSEVNKVKKGISVKKRLGVAMPTERAEQKRPMHKAVRHSDEMQAKTTSFKLSSKFNSQSETKISTALITASSFKSDNSQTKTTGSVQAPKSKLFTLKRKIDGESDVSPPKKVRFGRTTHRLIPATPSPSDPISYVKNYPKLTMIINNRENAAANNTLSSGVKIGSLNSDSLSDRLGVKARIGNKFVQGRLGKRMGTMVQEGSRGAKKSTIKDRLG